MRSGVSGMSTKRTPNGDSASSIAAIEDALSPFNVHFLDMPLTPERIVSALRAAGAYEKLSAA